MKSERGKWELKGKMWGEWWKVRGEKWEGKVKVEVWKGRVSWRVQSERGKWELKGKKWERKVRVEGWKVREESESWGLKSERWRVKSERGKWRGRDKRQNLPLLWTHAWRPSHHRRSYLRPNKLLILTVPDCSDQQSRTGIITTSGTKADKTLLSRFVVFPRCICNRKGQSEEN